MVRPFRLARLTASLVLLGFVTAGVKADDSLAGVYGAILRGDYKAGLAKLEALPAAAEPGPEVREVTGWLKHFDEMSRSRSELAKKALDWNVEQAHKADEQGRVYLALAFATQAANYAADEAAFRGEAWLGRLRAKALALGADYEQRSKWSHAWAFYNRLDRLWPNDDAITKLQKRAARHARLEVVYKERKAVQERIKGVTRTIFDRVVRAINDNYYQEPDFKKLADGALDQLGALCNTTKLNDVFDGVANPDLREHFSAGLERIRQKMHADRDFGYADLRSLFLEVRDLNKSSVAIPEELLIVEFLEGGLGELDDFTSVVWPADSVDFDKRMIGNFCGVGIQLGVDETTSRLKVVTPLENSPALEAGIRPNDLILEVNGESTKSWTTDDAVDNITGEAGTTVTLTIYRPESKEKFNFPLVRRQIQLTTVRGVKRQPGSTDNWDYMLEKDGGVAYIRLTGFNPDSHQELKAALSQARSQGMRGLILDLRHNPGGLLEVAVHTVSMFLRKGEVVSTQGRAERKQHLPVDGDGEYADLPLVVLVNEGSASASEIVAGALQQHDRALVLGERTFGKGSVQRVLQVSNDARLKLTTALYYLPNGVSPHKQLGDDKWGVDPDTLIKLTPIEFRKVLDRETRAFVITNDRATTGIKVESPAEETPAADKDKPAASDTLATDDGAEDLLSEDDIALLQSAPYEAPDADPQLETAILHLRVKLAANLPWPRQVVAKKDDPAAPAR